MNNPLAVAEADIEPEAKPTKRQKALAAMLTTGVFLVVYILSVGPMAGIHRAADFKEFGQTLEVIYKPLVVIVKKDVRPFSTGLKWYINIFR
ncbi:MAG: hypothetical protein CMJ78_19385 [Planctomycetaceae bacterium]|nr:hypothetical protein [Planctomycetaceae bacterium]